MTSAKKETTVPTVTIQGSCHFLELYKQAEEGETEEAEEEAGGRRGGGGS